MKRPSVSWITIPLIVARVRFDSVLFGVCRMSTRSGEPQAADAAVAVTASAAASAR
jgi:hypothetical protein